MYESPITIYIDNAIKDYRNAREAMIFDGVCGAVERVGISVDKEELRRALAYDRNQYTKGYRDGERDAKPKWVNVEERLPEPGVRVLALVNFGKERSPHTMSYTANGNWSVNMMNGEAVTHWMPLPEPPKEEANENA